MTWAVGGLGSCRVHTPLSIIAGKGSIKFRTDPVIGYLHNPLELLQAIALLRGEIHAPRELAPLINIGAPDMLGSEDRFAKLFTNVDVLVIEVSSIRIIEYRGWHLQINRFGEFLASVGVDKGKVNRLFKSASARAEIAGEIGTGEQAELARRLVLESNFYEMQADDLADALGKLRMSVAQHPVIFVGTLVHDFNGVVIPQRILLWETLLQLARQQPEVGLINPTDYIDRDGATMAMKDLGHYKVEYEPIAADEIFSRLQDFCQESKLAQMLATRRIKRREVRQKAAQAAE